MPIVIKELFPSDPLSEAVEKVNFNFDQLLLAGGGPPGPPGVGGPPGPIGPQGSRGDHWFVGSSAFGQTADHDGGSPLQIQDHFVDSNGDVWSYFDNGLGSTGWTYSGINLAGPPGSTGGTGGSYEWDLYPGVTGNAFSTGYGPAATLLGTDDLNLNFLIPLGPTKNGMILGDPDWFYTKLSGWNNIPNSVGGVAQSTPRLTVIQRTVDYYGSNGIQIGAYGLTGSTAINDSTLTPASTLPIGASVSALDFFCLGIGIVNSYNREILGNYASHSAMVKTFRRDITIEAGNDQFPINTSPNIRMRSNAFAIQSWDESRWISSGATSNYLAPILKSNVISINSVATATNNSTPYIQLQGASGPGGYGTVLIGPVQPGVLLPSGTDFFNYSLTLSRNISTVATNQAQIIFFDSKNASNANDWNAKFVSFNEGALLTQTRGIVVSTPRFGVLGKENTLSANSKPWFPFHVNQNGAGVQLPTTAWPSTPSPFNNYGWLAGFDKYDSTSISSISFSRGFGINYINSSRYDNNVTATVKTYREIALNAYWTNNIIALNDSTVWTYPSGVTSTTTRVVPHLSIQTDSELTYGNVAFGFVPGGTSASGNTPSGSPYHQAQSYAPWSKVSINGSIRIGSTALGYHTVYRNNAPFTNGALIEGAILRGSTSLDQLISTDLHSAFSIQNVLGFPNSAPYGILSMDRTQSDTFLARSKGSTARPAYMLADAKSGLRLGSTAGDAYLVASNISATASMTSTSTGSDVARFSTLTDFPNQQGVPGFQVMNRFAKKPRYMTTAQLMQTSVFRYYYISGETRPQSYSLFTIPTDSSILFLDLSGFGVLRYSSNKPSSWPYSGTPIVLNSVANTGLNGFKPDGTSYNLAQGIDYQMFTLEPGKYDGQEFTLIVGDVMTGYEDPQGRSNAFVLSAQTPLGTVSTTPPVTLPSNTSYPDRIVMAKEPVLNPASQLDASPSFTQQTVYRTNIPYGPFWRPTGATYFNSYHGQPADTFGGPWPWPAGVSAVAVSIPSDTKVNDPAGTEITNLSLLSADKQTWTNVGQFSTGTGWKNITFVWMKIRSTGSAVPGQYSEADFAWVETSRESLARPKSTITYVGSGGAGGAQPLLVTGGGK
jgi:hypothetical protein